MYISQYTHSSNNSLVVSVSCLLWVMLQWIQCKYIWDTDSITCGYLPRRENSGPMIALFLILKKNPHSLEINSNHLKKLLWWCIMVSFSPHQHWNFCSLFFLTKAILTNVIVVLTWIYLMISDVEYSFINLLSILISSSRHENRKIR